MTKTEAIKKVAAAAIKHEQKYGTGSAKMETTKDAKVLVLVAYFPDLPNWTYKQASKGRYGLDRSHDIRGRTKKEPRWVVRYAVHFETP